MIGEPRENRAQARPIANADELRRMVDAAAATAVPVGADAEEPTRPAKRMRRRLDTVALSAGVLAVVAVVSAGTVAAVQVATASPAASSLESLQADEAAIQNAYQSLKSTRDRIVADIQTQTTDAAALRGALVATSTTPDPASDQAEVLPVTDPAALTQALAGVDAYTQGLAAVSVPELPAEYSRPEIDEDSLAEVGSAIDAAQEQLILLDAANGEVRAIETQVQALRAPAEQVMSTFAATFPGAAQAANDRYPDAEEALRVALTDAAARVAGADLWEPANVATLSVYRDAFGAVAADQMRVEIERQNQLQLEEEQRQRDQQQNQQQPEQEQSPPTEGETEPPADGTDPGTEPGTEPPPEGDQPSP